MESKDYFATVARAWDEMRSGFFTEEMRDDAIARARLAKDALVADVGTGTGFVLSGLAEQRRRLVGFDASPEMLEVARRRLSNFEHVSLCVAVGEKLPSADYVFDAVFANMYLHHTPDPGAAVRELARILKPGGTLIITDLDHHDQIWMRAAMADRWLGFRREEVREWFQGAGLTAVDVDCAAGTCDCSGPQEETISLSIFVASGQKGLQEEL